MPNDSTFRMLKKYQDAAPPQLFLSSLFQTPGENFHDQEKVTIDIVRNDPRIAVPLANGSESGARFVEKTKYVNVEYTPVRYDTGVQVSSFNSSKRRPGVDPFTDVGLLRDIVSETMASVKMVDDMTRRGVELQCAQVLTTGAISLTDSAGVVVYSCNFTPKGTHFVTTGTAWAADGSTGDPEGDISAIAEVIRRDGKSNVTQVICGRLAVQRLFANVRIRSNLNLYKANFGTIEPVTKAHNATFHGRLQLGTEVVEIWSYKETYINPQTGAQTPYLPDNKVIVRAPDGRLDLTFGSIPTLLPPDSRLAQFMPARMSDPLTGLDLSINAYASLNNKNLIVEVGTRALAIPTALDTFGCLTVF
jgi:hypothetical protein